MSKLLKLSSLLVLPIVMAIACAKKDDKQETATAPMNNNCVLNNCDNSVYNNYGQFGFSPYNLNGMSYVSWYYQYGSGMGFGQFCNCTANTYPVYNSAYGLGCVNSQVIAPFFSVAAAWTLQPNNFQWTAMPLYSNINGPFNPYATGYPGSYGYNPYLGGSGYPYNPFSTGGFGGGFGTGFGYGNSCSNRVYEACQVNLPVNCANNGICRPTVPGSPLGICTAN